MRIILLGVSIIMSTVALQAMNTDADDEPSERISTIVSTYASRIWQLRFTNDINGSQDLLGLSYMLAYELARRLSMLQQGHEKNFPAILRYKMVERIEDRDDDQSLHGIDRILLLYASYRIIGNIEFKKAFLSDSIQQLFLSKFQSFQKQLLKNKQYTHTQRYRLTL